MRLSISVNLLGRCVTVCLPFSLWFALPTFTGSQQGGGAAIADPCRTRILHCYCIPTKVQMGLACYCLPLACYCPLLACYCLLLACYCLPLTACYCLSLTAYPLGYYYRLPACLLLALTRLLAIVYRLPALLAGAALVIVHMRVADRIAYPHGVWDCLCYSRPVSHMLLSTACLLLSTACLLLSAAYRLPLSIAYRLPSCYYYRLPACLLLALTRLLAMVYRLPALLAGAALVIAHTRVADRIDYPYGVWDCLCYSRPVSHMGLPTHARPSC